MIEALRFALLAAFILLAWLALRSEGMAQTCEASFYDRGARTANGERFRPMGRTAASRTLPFNSLIRVSFDGRSTIVRINDRGPASWTGRCIDLSRGAARAIGLEPKGVGRVTIERVR